MLQQLVSYLAYGSLVMGATSAYLYLNKLWSRKHIPEVASSISIPGVILEAIPSFIFGTYYFVNREMVGVINSSIWIASATCYIFIGSGFWVQGQRRAGIWRLAWRSVRSERKELGNLVQSILHPGSSRPLVQLLHRLAEVDGEVSEQEARMVSDIAEQMNLDVTIEPHRVSASRTQRLLNIRDALQDYLITSPPYRNVEQLEHLMRRLNRSDGFEHADEQHAFDEMQGLIRDYLQEGGQQAAYRVLVAPQSESQITRLNELLRNAPFHGEAGGRGLTVGEFHTREFANTICNEYRELGFFCVVTDEIAAA